MLMGENMSLLQDAKNIKNIDPAARNLAHVILLYQGFHALIYFRISHFFYKHKCYFLARLISQTGRTFTGIEIHPGATIGNNFFIDHGSGVVIGETAIIGDNVTIYHGVTLGGTGKQTGKRHPTIGNHVVIGAGAKILGAITIGEHSRIGANSVVLKNMPKNATIIGIPASAVRIDGEEVCKQAEKEYNHLDYPDIVHDQLEKLIKENQELKEKLNNYR